MTIAECVELLVNPWEQLTMVLERQLDIEPINDRIGDAGANLG